MQYLKRLQLIFIPMLLLFCFAPGLLAQKHYKDLKYPRLHKINVPKVERMELDNGMILFLVEDHELPLINLSARIGVGSINEPADKIGLASVTGTVMRTGGTKTRSGDEIDELLESIAASVETGIGQTSGFASMSVLKEDVDTGLEILADILMHPAFPQEKIDLAKVEERSAIARRNDDANGLAFREFAKLIYGPQSVYARHTEYATIDAITRDDLVAFHKKYFHPNNVMVGVWGDFKAKDMANKIRAAFKTWKKGAVERPEPPQVTYNYDYSVNLIRKSDVNQSTILIGHIGGMLDNPDYYALTVMNEILSGGFASRLFSRVRSNQGLAYSVFGRYGADFKHPGQFYVGCMTKSQTTVQAIRSLLKEVKLIQQEEVTDEELKLAKDSYFNSYVFNFDTKSEVVTRLMTYEYYGYPKDFLEKTKENIEKVTKADVLRVAKKYLRPEQVRILVVGNDKDFDEPLSVLGSVNEVDITIPVAEESLSEATEESVAKGKALFQKAIAACGGAEAFSKVKNVKYIGSMTVSTPQGEMSMDGVMTLVFPDRFRMDMTTPMGDISQIMNGDQAWMVTPQGAMPAPAPVKESMKESVWHDLAFLFANAGSDKLAIQHLGSEELDGKKVEVLGITPEGMKSMKLVVDAETHMPRMFRYQAMSMRGPAATEEIFLEFGEFGGLHLPSKVVVKQNGKKAQEMLVKETKVNIDVDDALFTVKK